MVSRFLFMAYARIGTLEVGPGKQFARIEAAVLAAQSGDTIMVYPDPSGYPGTAVKIQVPSLTIRGANSTPVVVTGTGFDYSGAGSVPRAIIQVDPSGNGATIQNLNLSDAHNQTFNGAGVRIQSASNVTVSDCIIHGNDMGIMSNGQDNNPSAGSNQIIQYCRIDQNGSLADPGYNHNLYLGGTNARLFMCEISRALTGHNLKSRCHYLQVEACWIHDSANREVDLPEAWDTTRPNSNAVIIGNRIIKDPNCPGNHGTMFFGKESGNRMGNVYLFANTIVSSFSSPILQINVNDSRVVATGNIILNVVQNQAAFLSSSDPNQSFVANANQVSKGYGQLGGTNYYGVTIGDPFRLVIPPYLYKDGSLGKPFLAKWLDGNGTPQSATVALGASLKVGPRT
jgi:parallel beta-helix repeat protein